jgi:hypothetical protein
MAFVVRRPGDRWEIRESIMTKAGPRAHTLASFKELSPEVIERAVARARTRVDRESLRRAVKRAGVPFERAPEDALAESLLRSVARGATVRPGLRRLLLDRLDGAKRGAEHDDSFIEWIGASLEARGAALVDLLDLADRLPQSRRGPLRFPRLSPTRASS